MSTNIKALAAYELAKHASNVSELPPRVEYALRRVGGRDMLGEYSLRFRQAWNEAPIVDADLDTKFVSEILVRPLERKDGIR